MRENRRFLDGSRPQLPLQPAAKRSQSLPIGRAGTFVLEPVLGTGQRVGHRFASWPAPIEVVRGEAGSFESYAHAIEQLDSAQFPQCTEDFAIFERGLVDPQ